MKIRLVPVKEGIIITFNTRYVVGQ